MSRSLVLGNGCLLLCLDNDAQVRDFYYPYPGEKNHVRSHHHRIGVWSEDKFFWFSDPAWEKKITYKKDTLVGDMSFINKILNIEIKIENSVHHKKNIYVNKIRVINLDSREKTLKIFLNQHFQIDGDNIGDTVYYNPFTKSLIYYKGRRYFLINGILNNQPFSEYATGSADEGFKEGTYKDAEDGYLSGNPIEHGSVDSTIAFNISLKPDSEEEIYYWIAVGKKFNEVKDLNDFVLRQTPGALLGSIEKYWKTWLSKSRIVFSGLNEKIEDLFKKSLLIIRTHTGNNGAIIASSDTTLLFHKKDTYNYVWPRDGALICRSLDKAGYSGITRSFFSFCKDMQSQDGYLFHKYLPDGSLGSSWHPWINKKNEPQLPIQEDETALVLDALWKKYLVYKNKPYIQSLYSSLIKKSADFMCSFIDPETNLPKESYDLWEEKLGVHTFTCATVYAGLMAAYNFAKLLKKRKDAEKYLETAEKIKRAIIEKLYDKKKGIFLKRIYRENGEWIKDFTIDMSSVYGIFEYGILDVNDSRVKTAMEKTISALGHFNQGIYAMSRYEGDMYFKEKNAKKGNIWFITTLWLAEYYILKAKTVEELKPAKDILEWVVSHALPSGILAEQISPLTNKPLSVAPLVWSHAGFVIAVIKYLRKLDFLKIKKTFP